MTQDIGTNLVKQPPLTTAKGNGGETFKKIYFPQPPPTKPVQFSVLTLLKGVTLLGLFSGLIASIVHGQQRVEPYQTKYNDVQWALRCLSYAKPHQHFSSYNTFHGFIQSLNLLHKNLQQPLTKPWNTLASKVDGARQMDYIVKDKTDLTEDDITVLYKEFQDLAKIVKVKAPVNKEEFTLLLDAYQFYLGVKDNLDHYEDEKLLYTDFLNTMGSKYDPQSLEAMVAQAQSEFEQAALYPQKQGQALKQNGAILALTLIGTLLCFVNPVALIKKGHRNNNDPHAFIKELIHPKPKKKTVHPLD